MSENRSSSAATWPPGAEHGALPPGTRFGELEVLRVVGVGGFGIVYLARDHSLNRDIALKEYMPGQLVTRRGPNAEVSVRSEAQSETFALGLRSFVNEARLLAHFDHPSLVKVYRFWEANNTAYMSMPFLQGQTLREQLRSMQTPPDERWFRSTFNPLFDALEMLHGQRVYHRDIAPDNIFLPSDGSPAVLLDLGAARQAIGDQTQAFTAILKPSYAPIEQYAESVSLRQGPWTDIYALGAVIYHLLKGVPPPPATARTIEDHCDVLAKLSFPEVSPTFLASIDWTLAVRPQDRPQSIAELRAALDGQVAPPPISARKHAAPAHPAQSYDSTVVDAVRTPAVAHESTIAVNRHASRGSAASVGTALKLRRWPAHAAWLWLAAGLLAVLASGLWWNAKKTRTTAAPKVAQMAAPDKPAHGVKTGVARSSALPAEPLQTQQPAAVRSSSGVTSSKAISPRESSIKPTADPHADAAPPIVLQPRAPSTTTDSSSTPNPQTSPRWPAVAEPTKQPQRQPVNPAESPSAEKPSVGPAEVCAPQSFIKRMLCLKSECGTARFYAHPQCVRMRAQEEAERQRRLLSGNR
jgi:serine/threonine protein kinase